MGTSLALAGRHLDQNRILRHPAHACTWLVTGGTILPLAVYLVLRQPDWGLMYVADGQQLSSALRVGLVSGGPLCAALGCVMTLTALRGAPLGGYAILGVSVAAWIGTLVWGWERIVRVGSYGTFHAGTRNLMPMLLDSRLSAVLLIALTALMGVWGYALITLRPHRA